MGRLSDLISRDGTGHKNYEERCRALSPGSEEDPYKRLHYVLAPAGSAALASAAQSAALKSRLLD